MAPQTIGTRLRADLILSRQVANGHDILVVKDPASDRFFRFGRIEAYILERLGETRSLETLRREVEAEFKAPLSEAALNKFLQRLGGLGFLCQEEPPNSAVVLKRRRALGDALYLRWKLFDPDALLDHLVRRLRFLFTPSFVVIAAAAIVIGTLVTAANWTEFGHDLRRLYSLRALALIYVTVLGVIAVHELAHGLTCKFFGGSVREIGFMLIFFQPAFYCNVSDAWLFPEKRKRLWVSFAGAFIELVLWGLATVAWRVTDPSTLVNFIALIVMATSGFRSLFNLNPLIKLDGYYLLSDCLDMPNLRRRAFRYLGGLIRRFLGSGVASVEGCSPREARIYFVYGVLAWLYSWSLLSFVLSRFAGFLVVRYQGWGFLLFVFLLAAIFRYSLLKLLRAPLSWLKVDRTMNGRFKWAIRIGLAALLGVALFFVRADLRVSGPCVVLPIQNADVRAEVEGIIREIHVSEGDAVRKGTLIASLSERDYRAELSKTEAEIEEEGAHLKLLKAGNRPEEIEPARTSLAKSKEQLKFAKMRLERDKELHEGHILSKRDLEASEELVAVRQKELEEANDKLKLLLAGSRQEEIEAREAEIGRLTAHKNYVGEQLGLLEVFSTIDGIVATHRIRDRIGQVVEPGDLIAEIHDMTTVNVEITVSEKEIAEVAVGQHVRLKAQAFPARSFEGAVASIAPVAADPEEGRPGRTVLVMTRLDNSSRLLKPQMTGHAKIYCGKRRLIDILTHRFVGFVKVEFWSWW